MSHFNLRCDGFKWLKCGMCGDMTKPLDADSLCPDCAGDVAVDETERND